MQTLRLIWPKKNQVLELAIISGRCGIARLALTRERSTHLLTCLTFAFGQWKRRKTGRLNTFQKYDDDLLDAYTKEFNYKTITDMKTVYNFEKTHYMLTLTIWRLKPMQKSNSCPNQKTASAKSSRTKSLPTKTKRRSFFTDTTADKRSI